MKKLILLFLFASLFTFKAKAEQYYVPYTIVPGTSYYGGNIYYYTPGTTYYYTPGTTYYYTQPRPATTDPNELCRVTSYKGRAVYIGGGRSGRNVCREVVSSGEFPASSYESQYRKNSSCFYPTNPYGQSYYYCCYEAGKSGCPGIR